VRGILFCGGPYIGYIEWAMETAQSVPVMIIMRQGNTKSNFNCGIKQGSATSCPYANAIIALKIEAWLITSPH
jgi:hypothetical protein